MKTRSIELMVLIRYWSSVIYYFCMIFYGGMIIFLYGNEDIGIARGTIIILSYVIGLACIGVKSTAILKNSNPFNIYYFKLYRIIIVIEITEMVVAYVFSNITMDSCLTFGGYFAYITFAFLCSQYMQKKIRENYKDRLRHKQFENEIINYYERVGLHPDNEISTYFNKFILFFFYVISLVFIYKYTLYSWTISVIFIVLNIYMLWKLHWKGIRNMLKYSKTYFFMICLASTCGVIFLKLIYNNYIRFAIFQGRDVQEYLMVFVLFYLPLIYYGNMISVVYSKKLYEWKE